MNRKNFFKSIGFGFGVSILGPIAGSIRSGSRKEFDPKKKIYIDKIESNYCEFLENIPRPLLSRPIFREKYFINGRIVKRLPFDIYVDRFGIQPSDIGRLYVYEEIFHDQEGRNNSLNRSQDQRESTKRGNPV